MAPNFLVDCTLAPPVIGRFSASRVVWHTVNMILHKAAQSTWESEASCGCRRRVQVCSSWRLSLSSSVRRLVTSAAYSRVARFAAAASACAACSAVSDASPPCTKRIPCYTPSTRLDAKEHATGPVNYQGVLLRLLFTISEEVQQVESMGLDMPGQLTRHAAGQPSAEPPGWPYWSLHSAAAPLLPPEPSARKSSSG